MVNKCRAACEMAAGTTPQSSISLPQIHILSMKIQRKKQMILLKSKKMLLKELKSNKKTKRYLACFLIINQYHFFLCLSCRTYHTISILIRSFVVPLNGTYIHRSKRLIYQDLSKEKEWPLSHSVLYNNSYT